MKKLLLLSAALLLCSLAHSQEAEEKGSYADFQLIPRFEFNPYFTPGQTGDGSSGYTFGNSSIYTLIEGAFSEHVSFVLNNHWFGMTNFGFGDAAGLYRIEDASGKYHPNLFYSNRANWLDLAYFNFNFGNWTFTVGKDCIASGGFEYDAYDVEVDYLTAPDGKILMASNLWYNLPSYQWGAKVAYGIGEHTTLALQMLTSPFGERPFSSGLFSYSLKWDGNYGPFSNMWSVTALQKADRSFDWLIALAQQVELGNFTLGFDWYNLNDVEYGDDDTPCALLPGNTFRPSVAFAPSDKFNVKLVGNLYTEPGSGLSDVNAGLSFHYLPIEMLQLHAACAWDMTTKAVSAMAGVKMNLTFLSL